MMAAMFNRTEMVDYLISQGANPKATDAQGVTALAAAQTMGAVDTAAQPGGYYGPAGMGEFRGPPTLAKIKPTALDKVTGARLWDVAEQLTGAVFKPAP